MCDQYDYLFSIDCESLGLYGEAFAVGVSVIDLTKKTECDSFVAACRMETLSEYSPNHPSAKWLKDNVLPHLENEYNCSNPKEMREKFWQFYSQYKSKRTLFITDCGAPVEANFFRMCVADDPSRTWDGPYPLHEVGTLLLANHKDPIAIYPRLDKELPIHHPLGDARQSGRIFHELLKK